jgi:hypothetical protein
MVRDGNLITGQNPASARRVVDELALTLLRQRASGAHQRTPARRATTKRLPAAAAVR